MYRVTVFLLSAITIFSSCQVDSFSPEQAVSNDIPAELTPYFVKFQNEARQYGVEVDYEGSEVTAELRHIDEGSVAGSCTTNGHSLRHITIDTEFWSRASHLTREMVVYHELGHCILGRDHREDAFQSGICRSIMRSGLGSCADAYTSEHRGYFVEELFTVHE